jgi:hypothetical protein
LYPGKHCTSTVCSVWLLMVQFFTIVGKPVRIVSHMEIKFLQRIIESTSGRGKIPKKKMEKREQKPIILVYCFTNKTATFFVLVCQQKFNIKPA